MAYRPINHTADLRIEVTGTTREALFENCALAVTDLLTDPDAVEAESSRLLAIEGLDPVDLLINFLREVLYLFSGEFFLVKSVRVLDLSDTRIRAELTGTAFATDRNAIRTEIKAVTYHQASIQQTEKGWTAKVLFDV